MNDPADSSDLTARIQSELAEIAQTHMPFGRYGPAHFPPCGAPIYNLPAEYLYYFTVKGFPKGRLGELLRIVYQTKVDGADSIFDEMRQKTGGSRFPRKTRRTNYRFGD